MDLREIAIALLVLIILGRGIGIIWPKKLKSFAKWFSSLSPNSLKAIALIFALIGLWLLYTLLSLVAPHLIFLSAFGLVMIFASIVISSTSFYKAIVSTVLKQDDNWIRLRCLAAVAIAAFFLYLILK